METDLVTEDFRIVKNVNNYEESDISWSDGAFPLHWGGK